MSDPLFTIENSVTAEIVEKKSRFIAQIQHVETEDEALEFIASVKKEHSQARHNVYAYIVKGAGALSERIRFTDDGEPSGTAGKPVLETLQHASLQNIACVVTRYFGGTLLGTGGLVRAYSGAVKAAIENATMSDTIVPLIEYANFSQRIPYSDLESLKRKIKQMNGVIDSVEYSEEVDIKYRLPKT